jgi:MioC protein
MPFSRSGISISVIYDLIVQFIFTIPTFQKHKIHDFRGLVYGRDYIFEPTEGLKKGYMTAQCKGVKRGDWIILEDNGRSYRYQVERIDYYSEPSDMWIALLNQAMVEET